ncbi:hypothetical protein LTR99_009045 [Exophiala xenobiotica]|uniref:Uncharacterized protein n=1 Tax=Vermiconidia calcicola TaxID=1690605 RepID=A0AAV9PZR5_9PEZI|nr:hypothetical protein LTR96_009638 [Exophiala xenobiotica]KAK5532311.1 hypothetical protein LTR25_007844 [Vermiconidia calcicola]KAK5541849.1 hypothetical protein LTR23_005451 [Chaetothyriales sp. CCFEE 6169]KAK5295456.1 hypothetical protein LTR99_009045 [Exophiala xenobiotica]KAK5333684.1 hypothetical protein LTR98_010022 [Exophiala xenobiotica]
MSSTESTHPDPGVVPQTSSEVNKGQVDPVKPSQTPGLAKLPADVKTTISKADAIILRLSKLIKTTAGLGAALSTLNYSIYLAAYLHAQSPTRAAVLAYIGRLLGRSTRSKVLPPSAATSTGSFLTPLGSLLSDTRTSLRLTGLIPLYIWLKSLTSNKGQMDPSLRRVALLQCSGYITFQLLENIYHLAGKGVVPMTLIEKRGGINTWVRWSCRAWLVGVASDYLRLWREAQIEKESTTASSNKTAREKEDFDRKWWNEFMVATYWLPVAVHYSLYPEGIKGFNTGLVGFFGLMAGLNNFRNQWAATA